MEKTIESKNSWTLSKVWNESVEQREERPVEPRNRMWASELGKSDIDIYLKLMGEKPTNPFTARALRKFEAGNVFEWIVELILRRCGIYKESQAWVKSKMTDCLEVSGKLDHIAGSVPVFTQGMELPDVFGRASLAIMNYFKEKYPNGLEEMILEIKSVSSYGIEKVYATGKCIQEHDLQTFHYAYNRKKNALIVYISRDDLRMCDIFIDHKDPVLEQRYISKIKRVTDFYNKKIEPPIEPAIEFDEDDKKFSRNFNAQYSPYLTRNYGVADEAEFDEKYSPLVERWNRVLGRMKEGKELTDNNKEALTEMSENGFDVMKITSLFEKKNETI